MLILNINRAIPRIVRRRPVRIHNSTVRKLSLFINTIKLQGGTHYRTMRGIAVYIRILSRIFQKQVNISENTAIFTCVGMDTQLVSYL